MKAIALFDPRMNNGIRGLIQFEQSQPQYPVRITFHLSGFKPLSSHAIHIHEYGDLTEGCKTLGAHFNPTQRPHSHSEKGHAGDLFNNFQTDVQGEFHQQFNTDKISLFLNQRNILGRSVVIHQFPDDLGLKGIIDVQGNLILYEHMTNEQLFRHAHRLGYTKDIPTSQINRKRILDKLIQESVTTGNASTRIACAIIALRKP
jgi:Cu-Zn family superoxide dismutase